MNLPFDFKTRFSDFVSLRNMQLTAFDAVIIKARSDATRTTLSLLSIVLLIVKLFL